MRLKNIPGSRERIAESSYLIMEEPAADATFLEDERQTGRKVMGNWAVKGHWAEVFANDHPVYIEIGMGKGTFIMDNARRYPEINFVGIEKYSSVLLRAVQKQDEEQLPNVRFIRMDAEYICDVFAPGEVKKIYLNFSDPWPKEKHAKRRLTSRQFLAKYEQLLPADALVEFKTDNTLLFDFSLEEAEAAGWPIIASTYDLHHDKDLNIGNIMTEYEEKFSGKGQKICKMIIKKP